MTNLSQDVLRSIEADSFWCMSKLLDGIQVSWGRGVCPLTGVTALSSSRRQGACSAHPSIRRFHCSTELNLWVKPRGNKRVFLCSWCCPN